MRISHDLRSRPRNMNPAFARASSRLFLDPEPLPRKPREVEPCSSPTAWVSSASGTKISSSRWSGALHAVQNNFPLLTSVLQLGHFNPRSSRVPPPVPDHVLEIGFKSLTFEMSPDGSLSRAKTASRGRIRSQP